MDDLIRRQNLITTLTVTAEETKQMKVGDLKKVINVINNQPSAQQWIPCSKRLPEIGQTVITSSDLGRVREATYKGFDAWTIHGVVHWTDEILSWMPMPDPYKEDN